MNDEEQLFAAISKQNVELLKKLLASGVNPNAINDFGDTALCEACDSWHTPENRFRMVEALLDAGADPKIIDEEGGGPLFACVIAKDARLIDYLVSRGADPNLEHDMGTSIYAWADFDYMYDEYGLVLPEEPTEEDKVNEDAWLAFLSRLAEVYEKQPPDYLIALRKAELFKASEGENSG
ncbi:MAG: ankyrin repeat domain-containing protein [Pseudomonadales bacterium]|nr:ankyrin repeat domain-containing protein [Pseudomonadales bacterium]